MSHPEIDHDLALLDFFPAGKEVRIGGQRRVGESCANARIRNIDDYLRQYPSGEAISEFERFKMCGKFTAMASWAEIADFLRPLARAHIGGGNDQHVTYQVMSDLPVIIFDPELNRRRVIAMRWGFPHPKDWRRPQPIHARSETIEKIGVFAESFHMGQRGIVLANTFNEAPESGEQHTITPDCEVSAIAFIWRRFAAPPYACVMVTVAANELIASLPTDRMPAFLSSADWPKWLGELPASVDELKACLKTAPGKNWLMTKELRLRHPRSKPTVADLRGLR